MIFKQFAKKIRDKFLLNAVRSLFASECSAILERSRAKWEECKAFAKAYYPETEIISVNQVGLKGIFKDLYQNDGGK